MTRLTLIPSMLQKISLGTSTISNNTSIYLSRKGYGDEIPTLTLNQRMLWRRKDNMKVLVACEFSGIVRDAFIAKGHDAISCDLLPTERPGAHYQGDVRDILGNGFDLMIAHPPCTYLSNAGARFMYPKGILNQEGLDIALKAKEFFMELYNTDIKQICIENPIPTKIIGLPKYSQKIEPYYFGDMVQKKTCLWLKNLPLLTYKKPNYKPESTKLAGNWFNKGGKDRQKNRAKTFPGIAAAMAEQWGRL